MRRGRHPRRRAFFFYIQMSVMETSANISDFFKTPETRAVRLPSPRGSVRRASSPRQLGIPPPVVSFGVEFSDGARARPAPLRGAPRGVRVSRKGAARAFALSGTDDSPRTRLGAYRRPRRRADPRARPRAPRPIRDSPRPPRGALGVGRAAARPCRVFRDAARSRRSSREPRRTPRVPPPGASRRDPRFRRGRPACRRRAGRRRRRLPPPPPPRALRRGVFSALDHHRGGVSPGRDASSEIRRNNDRVAPRAARVELPDDHARRARL